MPSNVKKRDSKDRILLTTIKYAYDYSGQPIYNDMTDANMISQPIEQIETNYSTNREVYRKKINYDHFPEVFGSIFPTSIQSAINGASLRTEKSFDAYDQFGNILQETGLDGVPKSYLWGYQNMYTVAVLEGIHYSQIPALYKANNQIYNPLNDEELQILLEGLRNHFSSKYMITSYSYRSLVGISRKVDPNLLSTYYEYDDIGRLLQSKDHNQNILTSYSYHNRGPGPLFLTPLEYTNVPILRSHNYQCSFGRWHFYNRVVPGGTKFHPSMQESADFYAREEVNIPLTPGLPPDCLDISEMVRIELNCIEGIVIPSEVEVDLIKDDAIYATLRYYNMDTYAPYNTIYVPPGTYRLSLRVRPDINYGDKGIIVSFLEPIEGVEFQSGELCELLAGQVYWFGIHGVTYSSP